jgi:hypothetical protein
MAERAAASRTRRSVYAVEAARGGRARRWLAATLVVAACPSALLSLVAIWAHETLLDTDRYVATVAPIIKHPGVTHSLGTFTDDKVVEALGLQGRLTPEVLSRLNRAVQNSLRTDAAASAWTSINRSTHKQLIAALRNDSGHITSGEDTVSADLMPFISFGLNALRHTLPSSIASNLNLPRIDPSASPDRQRAQLAAALGRPLPPDFGRVVLLRGGQLGRARRALRLFDLIEWALIGVTALFAGLAVVLSPRRRRTLIYLGVGLVVVVVIARVVISRLEPPILGSFQAGDLAPAFKTAITTFLSSLAAFTTWLLVVGAVIAAVAYLAGPPVWLARIFGGKGTAAGGGC